MSSPLVNSLQAFVAVARRSSFSAAARGGRARLPGAEGRAERAGRPAGPRLHRSALRLRRLPLRLAPRQRRRSAQERRPGPGAHRGSVPGSDAGVEGVGLFFGLDAFIAGELDRGELQIVLEEYARPVEGMFLYFPSRAQVSSFTDAARDLGVSASALSQSVQRLEEEVGVALLHRTSRSVALTDQGQRLLDEAGPALDQAFEALTQATARPGAGGESIEYATVSHTTTDTDGYIYGALLPAVNDFSWGWIGWDTQPKTLTSYTHSSIVAFTHVNPSPPGVKDNTSTTTLYTVWYPGGPANKAVVTLMNDGSVLVDNDYWGVDGAAGVFTWDGLGTFDVTNNQSQAVSGTGPQ